MLLSSGSSVSVSQIALVIACQYQEKLLCLSHTYLCPAVWLLKSEQIMKKKIQYFSNIAVDKRKVSIYPDYGYTADTVSYKTLW